MEVLGVIPARGGSKGVPHKNIRNMLGAPLIAWTIDCANRSSVLTDSCVTTDDEAIMRIATQYGGRVPFRRPSELATDNALAIPTIQHATHAMEGWRNKKYDIVVMLQPTSPLKTPQDIDCALHMLLENPKADSVISIVDVGNNHPMKMKIFTNDLFINDYEKPKTENPPRQELPPVYIVNGVLYATRREILINEDSFAGQHCLGYVMPESRSINIDTECDFLIAEMEAQRQGLAPPIPKTDGKY